MRFYKYGRYWYTTRKEAEEIRKDKETIHYDKGIKAYWIKRSRKGFWNF